MRRFLRDNESIPIPADWNIMKFIASIDKRRRKQFGFDPKPSPPKPAAKPKPVAKKRKYTKKKTPRKSPAKKKKVETEDEDDDISEPEHDIAKGSSFIFLLTPRRHWQMD